MKILILTMSLFFSVFASAASPYMIVCKNAVIQLSIKKELKHDGVINGWQKYWTQVDYKTLNKSGTLEAHISWRKDTRPEYNNLDITLMDQSEAAFRKQGLEGGSEGFGSIDARGVLGQKFKANWSTYKESEDAPELQSDSAELDCEM